MAITAVKQGVLSPTVIHYGDGEMAFLRKDAISSVMSRSEAVAYWQWFRGELTVQYQGSEAYYRYKGVSLATVFGLMNAESAGAFVATQIKPNHEVAKI